MNVGDKVTHINLVGTIVGVSSKGTPIVEWADDDYTEEDPVNLLPVEVPVPTEELDPSKEKE